VPLDADLATLVDAPPRLAASAGGLFVSVNSAGAAGATGLTLVLGSVGVDSRDIQVYCRT
jgi:hypothetical protein